MVQGTLEVMGTDTKTGSQKDPNECLVDHRPGCYTGKMEASKLLADLIQSVEMCVLTFPGDQ